MIRREMGGQDAFSKATLDLTLMKGGGTIRRNVWYGSLSNVLGLNAFKAKKNGRGR